MVTLHGFTVKQIKRLSLPFATNAVAQPPPPSLNGNDGTTIRALIPYSNTHTKS